MIGVICKPGQLEAVEEFFQLFKTPWELHRSGAHYSVVIATTGDVSDVNAQLVLLYGPDSLDSAIGLELGGLIQSPCLTYQGTSVPIYGEMRAVDGGQSGDVTVLAGQDVVGVKITGTHSTVMCLGYDLFDEVKFLLGNSQPLEHAHIPTLDTHIKMLRGWILAERISLIEIPPIPAGYGFAACLTHDIDFIGIRDHKFDHTMLGFLYRSTVGAVRNLLRGRITVRHLLKMWRAAASLPFVYLGWAEDFWHPFDWYLQAERDLPATYFLIPFKRRAGEHVPGPHASRRGTAYDIADLGDWAATLQKQGCELGIHGIDAWHSAEKGRAERQRVSEFAGPSTTGIRMHWLLQDTRTVSALEEAGFSYDSTAGYNDSIGYRNGTTQVFRPLGAQTLLELPMHIQDGALFLHNRLDLSESQARERCQRLIDSATKYGGVLTLLWHDRSHGPERFWGAFYLALLQQLKSLNVWFGSAAQVVHWFRQRREVRFERMETPEGVAARLCYTGGEVRPGFRVRRYLPCESNSSETHSDFVDIPWDGKPSSKIEQQVAWQFTPAVAHPTVH